MSTFSSKWHKCSGTDRVSSIGLFDYYHGTMSEIGDPIEPDVQHPYRPFEGFISTTGDNVLNKFDHISLIGERDCSFIGGWWVGVLA